VSGFLLSEGSLHLSDSSRLVFELLRALNLRDLLLCDLRLKFDRDARRLSQLLLLVLHLDGHFLELALEGDNSLTRLFINLAALKTRLLILTGL